MNRGRDKKPKKKRRKKADPFDPASWADRPASAHLLQKAKFPETAPVVEQLALGADVNAIDGEGKSALHWTAVLGNTEVAETLLAVDGVNADIPDEYGWTPLHLAVANNHPRIIDSLLNAGAAVNATTPSNETALDMAVANDVQAVIDRLVEAGAMTHDKVVAAEEAAAAKSRGRRRR
ncbi:ankyrin [Thecamonas trahens ATCC 50062]|uniref:Ankyrin n=1 Tax=Thecamonas trahens ATCC 50062 TaxID=461836 RepID=A0A0L0D8F4_THETB|nr:ankyrin [Thecamonas trahens ATCC 50062]KNC48366.1 ankyrin [Thecamonas trahens ATCC 50062]|eukprot:XP_013758486.1 ankyrin [Thecamonas trahens ATCC 50062]